MISSTPQQLKNRIRDNILDIRERIEKACASVGRNPDEVRLMVVTKTFPPEVINLALECNIDLIGENKVQELMSKLEYLCPKDVEKHIIGHLQRNKVKQVLPHVSMIQSVDSIKLACEISKQSERLGKNTNVLIQINVGDEETKTGFSVDETEEALFQIAEMPNITIEGLMSIPPICETESEIRKYFSELNKIFIDKKDKIYHNKSMTVLSIGMTSDYEAAIKEGSTLIRIGSGIFGQRDY
ncbi:MAG TPA: YggS family pyridoxal phosphate-dependent enzyme [Clostridiales bacterium]|jgi:pyridoxal phosphate enzyme (YggS family)|nr:YggS family pyridoxal phosphate-dependent enzyme [Clostridiales bacterium]